MNNDYIKESILNKKPQDIYFTGTVSSLNPLKVRLYPDDDEIQVVATGNLLGIQTGSRLVLVKFQNQLIAIALIQDNAYPPGSIGTEQKTSDTTIYNTTSLTSDSQLTLTLPAHGFYEIEIVLIVDGVSPTPGFKLGYSYSGITAQTARSTLGIGTSNSIDAYNADRMRCEGSRSISTTVEYGSPTWGFAIVREKFLLTTSTSNGSITPQYAQYVATAENVTVKDNSWIKYTKLKNN